MRQKALIFGLLMLVIAPASTAAPEGFRLSAPLTTRAIAVGGNPAVTVHCSRTLAIWRASARTEAEARAAGRANRATDEIELPTGRCATMERWLRGQKVYMDLLADALFTLAHEVGHIVLDTSDEVKADCYATRKYSAFARAFGVKRAATLQQLRNDAPLACFA
jgi:hypothetical protein